MFFLDSRPAMRRQYDPVLFYGLGQHRQANDGVIETAITFSARTEPYVSAVQYPTPECILGVRH
jgi:hypothetical protein